MDNPVDNVNHPSHYGGKDDPYEAVKVIEAWDLGFHLGNTVKYICRAGRKVVARRLEDLQKAAWYLARMIALLTIEECAWHQGFEIPSGWYDIPEGMRPGEWRRELYTAIGNGVPVWMAEAFGRADGPVLPAPIIPERGRYYRLSNGEAVRVLDLVVQKLIPTGVEHRVLWKATDDTKHYEKASQFRPRIMEEIGAELFESQRYD